MIDINRDVFRTLSNIDGGALKPLTISPKKFIIDLEHRPANIYLFKVNNRSSRKISETCSKLTIEALEECVKHSQS